LSWNSHGRGVDGRANQLSLSKQQIFPRGDAFGLAKKLGEASEAFSLCAQRVLTQSAQDESGQGKLWWCKPDCKWTEGIAPASEPSISQI